MNIYLIFYDISEDRRRLKVAALLERWGYERLQYSVFTGLQPPYDNAALWTALNRLMDTGRCPGDRLCCLSISRDAFEHMKVLGQMEADMDYLLGRRHVLIL